jgi:hypothetical protein
VEPSRACAREEMGNKPHHIPRKKVHASMCACPRESEIR